MRITYTAVLAEQDGRDVVATFVGRLVHVSDGVGVDLGRAVPIALAVVDRATADVMAAESRRHETDAAPAWDWGVGGYSPADAHRRAVCARARRTSTGNEPAADEPTRE